MTANRSDRSFGAVQTELNGERAATLGRVARRLEAALVRCAYLDTRLDVDDGTRVWQALIEEYREARFDSEQWRWALCVQREAIGLHEHTWVDRIYPAPRAR